jgi:hypothetical protein
MIIIIYDYLFIWRYIKREKMKRRSECCKLIIDLEKIIETFSLPIRESHLHLQVNTTKTSASSMIYQIMM